MAIKYLRASDIETDSTRYKSRLLGIGHEMYVTWTESMGTDWIPGVYGTMYGNNLIQKKVDSGLTDDNGQTIWTYSNEYALVIDDTSAIYNHMIAIHQAELIDGSVLIADGWNLT